MTVQEAQLALLTTTQKTALASLLALLINSKHRLGFGYAAWCIRAPSLEANIALAGMAQEEEGHAMVLEGLLRDELGQETPARDMVVTWDRWLQLGQSSPPLEAAPGWPQALLNSLALEIATTPALQILRDLPYRRLADRAHKMLQEERFHRIFGLESLHALARLSPRGPKLLEAGYRQAREQESTVKALAIAFFQASAAGIVPKEAPLIYEQRVAEADQRVLDAIDKTIV